MRDPIPPRRRLLFALVTLGLVGAFLEGAAFEVGRYLRSKAVFFEPVAREPGDYLAIRDPVLGWPPPRDFGGPRFDVSGARPSPAFPTPGAACVSVYGDSFTYGDGVPDEASWPNRLAEILGCRVANYGVPGYGTDQATLRFEGNESDEAPVAVLGHCSENVVRNLNQYRRLFAGSDQFGLKPRFRLTDDPGKSDGLALVPLPPADPADLPALLERPEDFLDYDVFAPGGEAGVTRLSFPYLLSLARSLRHYHVRAQLRGVPHYSEFYRPDHPSRAVELTARIMRRFERVARARGKRPVLQIIPTGLDLVAYRETGRWVYQSLMDRLASDGADVVDLGPGLLAAVGDRDPCEIFLACDNHFNAEGNALLAAEIAAALRERKLVPPPPATSP